MGEAPLDSERTLIPLSWAQQCIGLEIPESEDEPLYLGVDVARYGEDASIILPRKGLTIKPWEEFRGMNTISFGGFIKQTFYELEALGIAIDEIGVGAGVCDWLYKHNFASQVFGVNVASASSDKMKYHRLRDELWCRVRDKCQNALYSFPDQTVKIAGADIHLGEEICNELSQPTYDFDNNGAYQIESKKQMKDRGLASPNIADALCLTEYFHTVAGKIWDPKKLNKRKKKDRRGKRSSGRNWQTA
jgi:hypothetical protein